MGIFKTTACCVFALALFSAENAFADGTAVAGKILVTQSNDVEISFWETVKNSTVPEELEAYLEAFPNGVFAVLAKIRLKSLRPTKSKGTEATLPAPSKKTTQQPAATIPALQSAPSPSPATAKADEENDIPPVPKKLTRRNSIGVGVQQLKKFGAPSGIKITRLNENGAAISSGLQVGDEITKIDGKAVVQTLQLRNLFAQKEAGDLVEVTILRRSETKRFNLALQDSLGTYWVSAHQGSAEGMALLGAIYRFGGVIKKDMQKSIYWLNKSAKLNNVDANYHLGLIYYFGNDGISTNETKSFKHYLLAAQGGHLQAQARVGGFYGVGIGVAQNHGQAIYWLKKAAERNDAKSITDLGNLFLSGSWARKDLTKAAKWYSKGVEQGMLGAYSGLGYLHLSGLGGLKKDPSEAVRLFRFAADRGDTESLFYLALMYENGDGVLKDKNEAIRLYRKIASNYDRAASRLKKIGAPLYDLTEVQTLLNQNGYDAGTPDGKIGAKTRRAIRAFQVATSRKETGEPSVQLLSWLRTPSQDKSFSDQDFQISKPVDILSISASISGINLNNLNTWN